MAAGAFTCEFEVAALLAKGHFDVLAASERPLGLISPGSRTPPPHVKYRARPPPSVPHPPPQLHSTALSTTTHFHHQHHHHHQRWPAPSRLPVSPPVARLPVSSSLPRPPASPRRQLEVSRSLTATSPEPSPSVRFVATRSRPSFSFASCHSSVLSVRSPRTSSPISASSPQPSAPSRSPLRPTSSLSSRTPTCAPSTPSASPSSPRTFSSLVVSVVSAVKLHTS